MGLKNELANRIWTVYIWLLTNLHPKIDNEKLIFLSFQFIISLIPIYNYITLLSSIALNLSFHYMYCDLEYGN